MARLQVLLKGSVRKQNGENKQETCGTEHIWPQAWIWEGVSTCVMTVLLSRPTAVTKPRLCVLLPPPSQAVWLLSGPSPLPELAVMHSALSSRGSLTSIMRHSIPPEFSRSNTCTQEEQSRLRQKHKVIVRNIDVVLRYFCVLVLFPIFIMIPRNKKLSLHLEL